MKFNTTKDKHDTIQYNAVSYNKIYTIKDKTLRQQQ